MKKFLSILLLSAMALTLVACTAIDASEDKESAAPESAAPESSTQIETTSELSCETFDVADGEPIITEAIKKKALAAAAAHVDGDVEIIYQKGKIVYDEEKNEYYIHIFSYYKVEEDNAIFYPYAEYMYCLTDGESFSKDNEYDYHDYRYFQTIDGFLHILPKLKPFSIPESVKVTPHLLAPTDETKQLSDEDIAALYEILNRVTEEGKWLYTQFRSIPTYIVDFGSPDISYGICFGSVTSDEVAINDTTNQFCCTLTGDDAKAIIEILTK